MGPPIRILLIEDDVLDVELFTHAVKRDGLPHRIWHVDSADHLRTAFSDFNPQVVVCDFSLPGLNGFDALDITRAARPDVPFFFSSGSLGRERVQLALSRGATGYALKGHYESLLAQIREHLVC
jgi:CheY-like chemotaxis protein